VSCGLRAEAEETVAVETVDETDRFLCEVCAETKEIVALKKLRYTVFCVRYVLRPKKQLL
jgi:hypothetical protein